MVAESCMTSGALIWTFSNYQQNLGYEFCKGWGEPMVNVMESQGQGHDTKFVIIFIAAIITSIEMMSYLKLYRSLQEKQSSNPSLTTDMKRWKKRRNGLTLTGQIFCFVTELSFALLFRMLLSVPVFAGFHRSYIMAAAIIFLSAVTTVSFYIASPELRRHYFKSSY